MIKPLPALTAALVCLTLSACALPNNQKVTAQWKNHNISEAVAKLGPPRRIVEMPGGRNMYVWESDYDGGEYQCRKGLITDPAGTIVGASQYANTLLCE